jgi:hypothetical protein
MNVDASSQQDMQILTELNLKISSAEDAGDATWLASVLAPRLAFQRADDAKTVDNEITFLQKIKAGRISEARIIEPIAIFGNRAVVQCAVKVKDREYHNLRLFVKREGSWNFSPGPTNPCEFQR